MAQLPYSNINYHYHIYSLQLFTKFPLNLFFFNYCQLNNDFIQKQKNTCNIFVHIISVSTIFDKVANSLEFLQFFLILTNIRFIFIEVFILIQFLLILIFF